MAEFSLPIWGTFSSVRDVGSIDQVVVVGGWRPQSQSPLCLSPGLSFARATAERLSSPPPPPYTILSHSLLLWYFHVTKKNNTFFSEDQNSREKSILCTLVYNKCTRSKATRSEYCLKLSKYELAFALLRPILRTNLQIL